MRKLHYLFVALATTVFGVHAADTHYVPQTKSTLQAAIDDAADGDTIIVAANPAAYEVELVIDGRNNLVIKGTETARTLLKAKSSSAPLATIKNSFGIRFQNLTFINSTRGVEVSSSSDEIEFISNVFNVGSSGTALKDSSDSELTVEHNTFYGNEVGLKRASSSTTVRNNLFANNKTALSDSSSNTGRITFNGFDDNDDDGTRGSDAEDVTSSFAAPSLRDFHLRGDSEAKDKGTGTLPKDLGAYGGEGADDVPFPVQGVTITVDSDDGTNYSATVRWTAEPDYRFTGTYRVRYSLESAEIEINAVTSDTVPLTGLIPTMIDAPAAPANLTVTPGSKTLYLTWDSATDADWYTLRYGIGALTETVPEEIAGTSYQLTGLQNDALYQIELTAKARATLRVYVDALMGSDTSANSVEATARLGTEYASSAATATGYPEATVAFPVLPDEGCFIATAAYGYYSAPEVQALRDFRDRYLMTHAPGRALVHGYYKYSPPLADFIRKHDSARAITRILLFPVVVFAGHPGTTLAAILLFTTLAFAIRRRRQP